jgi:hypothetical protein
MSRATADPASGTAPTVYLHIGTMKSGTTFIQRRLKANSERLSHEGVLVPGAWGASIVAAARDVLNLGAPRGAESIAGRWDELRQQIAQWNGAAVIVSMEFFSTADEEQARRIVADLAPSTVEIVITARDLARVIPSSWQESTQNGAVWSYEEYTESIVTEDDDRPGSKFWRQQDLVRLVNVWSEAAGLEHVHVVTVPPSGPDPDLLWRRFCSVFDLSADDFTEDIPESRMNFALGHPSAEFMRRLNVELRSTTVSKADYLHYAKRLVAKETLNQRKDEPKVVLPPQHFDWVRERAQRMITDVAATGVDVVGELDDLLPQPAREAREPHAVTDGEVVDAAVDAIAALLLELTKRYERGAVRE